jgi:glycosyl hydrolase family 71
MTERTPAKRVTLFAPDGPYLRSVRGRGLSWPKAAYVLLLFVLVIVTGCGRPMAPRIAQGVPRAPQAAPKVLAVYMPWFGDSGHMDVGYSSQDPIVLRRQIESARQAGISAFLVNWYGDRRPFLDKSFRLLLRAAHQDGFQVALMYDESEADSGNATEDAIDALNLAYKAYIGPQARDHEAYLTYNGRPVIVIFPKGGKTNWNAVRARVNAWPSPPLLFYKDDPPAEYVAAFDGIYAWIHPGANGWMADGSDWGQQYLEGFYSKMKTKYPGKIAMGASWPGFDDAHAPWGLHRRMNARCGQTLTDTRALYHHYYSDSSQLPFLLIETWNDYEEGTAIEQPSAFLCKEAAK